jgi:hypothetical protein
MKNTLLPVILILFLSSCSTYEYCRVDAPGLTKNDSSELVWESDTVKLNYNFHGENGPLTLTIYNKLNKSLFINWKESALIRNGQTIGLYDAHLDLIRGKYTSSLLLTRNVSNTASDLSASFSLPDGTDIIAPNSYISKGLLSIWDGKEILDSSWASSLPVKTEYSVDNSSMKYKMQSYSSQASPANFKVYLTFKAGDEAGGAFSVSQSFYVAQVMQTAHGPQAFAPYVWKGDLFYFREKGQ